MSTRVPAWVGCYTGLSYAAYDCYGLVRFVYSVELGIELPAAVIPETDEERAAALVAGAGIGGWRLIEPGDHREFDVAEMFMPTAAGFRPIHIGVVVSDDTILHTLPPGGAALFRPRGAVQRYWRHPRVDGPR